MKLYCWGANTHGQLGQGEISNECTAPMEIDVAKDEINLNDIVSITGGGGHSFLIHKDGYIYGCGWNNKGQLGIEDPNLYRFTFINTLACYKVAQISSKWDTSFGITHAGQCIGWGANTFGQLGQQTTDISFSVKPIQLVGECGIQIASGLRHCAILTSDGYLMTSGDNRKGQLGHSGQQPAAGFQTVPGLTRVRTIACGQYQTFALTWDGKVYGWGCNKNGQLGLNPMLHQSVISPTEVTVPPDSIDIHTSVHSGWSHAALLTGSGKIINWGNNKYGQLGCPSYSRTEEWMPQEVVNMKAVQRLCIGSEHNIAILDDSSLMSWGWNEHGSCGVGHCNDVYQPSDILMNKTCLLSGVGAGHSLAIVT